jgi:hypothetical protein
MSLLLLHNLALECLYTFVLDQTHPELRVLAVDELEVLLPATELMVVLPLVVAPKGLLYQDGLVVEVTFVHSVAISALALPHQNTSQHSSYEALQHLC